jgi:hypothetical protein
MSANHSAAAFSVKISDNICSISDKSIHHKMERKIDIIFFTLIGNMRNTLIILVGKPEGKKETSWETRSKEEDNIEWCHKKKTNQECMD